MESKLEPKSQGRVRVAAVALLVMVMLGSPAAARAGAFHVYSCRTPAGEAAPTDGWSGSKAPESAIDDHASDTCASGGALVASIGEEAPHVEGVDRVTWSLNIPSRARLTSAALWRAGYVHGAETEAPRYEFWLTGEASKSIFDTCRYGKECQARGDMREPMSPSNFVQVPAADLGSQLFSNVACTTALPGQECEGGFGDPNHYAAVIYLYAADLTLEQAVGPSVSGVGGELAGAQTVGGRSPVTFSASDPGSGVYEAVFSVDGRVVQSTVVDDNGGRCRNVGETSDGSAAFLYLQPCLASVSSDVGLDTTRIANGTHRLVVSVIDAAGNAAPVLDRAITVYNPPPPGAPNGLNASSAASLAVRWRSTAKSSLTSSFGAAHTVTGRLTTVGGTPIVGAHVELIETPAATGAKSVTVPGPLTGPDGSFTVRLPRGLSSRTLRFAYRAHVGDPAPAAIRSLVLRVHAGIALTITPRTASVGQQIFFHGHLRGGQVPVAGKQLVLEARSPGGPWIEFKVVRTNAHGRFQASYRFKFPGPAVYQFRARSEPESDYPFAAGACKPLAVRER